MKKSYIEPNIKVLTIGTTQMMAESQLGINSTPQDNQSGDARENNMWDIWDNGEEE